MVVAYFQEQLNKEVCNENPDPAEESQNGQSFSYYSCPPVMQGLGKVQSCTLPSDAAGLYNSNLENGECSKCLAREKLWK